MIEFPNGDRLSLRAIARRVDIAATSLYLHFPDLDHLLAAVVERGFADLTEATTQAAQGTLDPFDELHRRCRAYCNFAMERPKLYHVMFQDALPTAGSFDPTDTPGRYSFNNLVTAVRRCLDMTGMLQNVDPSRLASLIWAAEHGIVLTRIARPTFPWAPLDEFVDDMVDRMMGINSGR